MNNGWGFGHRHDDAAERDGAFTIWEDVGTGGSDEDQNDVVLRHGGNMGIGEPVPDTKLHVNRSVSDPGTAIDLAEGTGIMVLGPMTDNLALDHQGLQARTGVLSGAGGGLILSATDLNLQRLGGDVLFHGAATDASDRSVITSDGKLGLGVAVPTERVDIADAYPDFMVGIKLRNTASNQNQGWRFGHLQDASSDRDGSFVIHEDVDGTGSDADQNDIVIRHGGHVGIGTAVPDAQLHVSGESDGAHVAIQIENTASSTDGGWLLSAGDDNAVPERQKTFMLHEKTGSSLTERITVLSSTGNVGINEPLPDTRLHVSRPVSDPAAAIDLVEGTGIMTIGPITDNIVMDYQGIQARHLLAGGTSMSGTSLNLQRLGGDVLIHGDAVLAPAQRVIIKEDGNVGLGTLAPVEKLHVEGALVVGDAQSASPPNGTIRYNGNDFEGRSGGTWSSLSGRSQWGLSGNANTTAVQFLGTTDNNDLRFKTNGIERMRIAANGNVGIGDFGAFPSTRLDVGTGTVRGGLFTTSGNACQMSGPGISYGTFSATAPRIYFSAGNNVVYFSKNPDLQSALFAHRFQVEQRPGTFGLFSIEVGNTVELAMDKDGRLGLGTSTPSAALHVVESGTVAGDNTGVEFMNSTAGSGTSTRVGLKVSTSGQWSSDATAKNIGLYVQNATGQTEASSNLAAVLNGNVVVGDTNGQHVGTGGTNVLAIQNGAVPAPPSGTTNAGIQIYSCDLAVGGAPVLHVMNGDGTVIKLHQAAAIDPADGSTVGPVYDPTTAALIENMRTRINQLEMILKAQGLLAP